MNLETIKNFIKSDSTPKVFFKYYLVIVVVGTFLLLLPFSLKEGISISFLDAIFTATSAVSVTGLATVTTIDTYSFFGQVVIMIMIICGGMGVMAMKASIYLLFRRKIGSKDRQLIMNEQQHFNVTGMAKLVKQILLITFTVTTIGFIFLSLRFYYSYDMDLHESIWYGLFHSVSAINNAGFDLFGNSLMNFTNDYYVQNVFIILIIFGGIGFPIIIEISRYIKNLFSKNRKFFKVSVFCKLTLSAYFIILLLGFLFIFIVEYDKGLAYNNNTFFDKIYMALFQSVTTRNAGFNTVDLSRFSNPTIFVMTMMMFIGAAPSSTGGGIRTTTIAVIGVYVYNRSLNRSDVISFKRKLPISTITSALFTFTLGMIILLFGTLIISLFENTTITNILFEVSSAFGTTGLSTGITASLSIISKLVLIIIMFTGQIGLTTMLGVWRDDNKTENEFTYAEENVLIG